MPGVAAALVVRTAVREAAAADASCVDGVDG